VAFASRRVTQKRHHQGWDVDVTFSSEFLPIVLVQRELAVTKSHDFVSDFDRGCGPHRVRQLRISYCITAISSELHDRCDILARHGRGRIQFLDFILEFVIPAAVVTRTTGWSDRSS
jgi:hypothetical protein